MYRRWVPIACIDLALPLVYVGCSAGKHRSPLMVFCWLLSQEGATPELVQEEFFGNFKKPVIEDYMADLKAGYLPNDLPKFYRALRQSPRRNHLSISLTGNAKI